MELQLTITLSDRLFELLEDKLPCLGRRVEKMLTRELGKQVRAESEITVTTLTAPEEPEADTPAEEAAQEEPKPFAEGPVTQPEDLPTEEDVRACIHRTRQRFEGEDYKNNTSSEIYKKYHKALNDEFKRISAVLGAEKPSKLPADQRAAFIAECDALIIGEDGNITPPPAPF